MTESFEIRISSKILKLFEDITGDISPIHVDNGFARAQGFEGTVAYGMLTASFFSTLVGVHLPGRFGVLHGVSFHFLKPVYPEDELRVTGEVIGVYESVGQFEMKGVIFNQKNIKVLQGTLRVGFSDK